MKALFFLIGYATCGVAYRLDSGEFETIGFPIAFMILGLLAALVRTRTKAKP